jgi:hypothetical protein
MMVRSKGPVPLARGAVLTVRVRIEGLTVEPSEDVIYWEGEVANASFLVRVPEDTGPGWRVGYARVYWGGQRVAVVTFVLDLGLGAEEPEELPSRTAHHGTAFASYASQNRNAVLGRIQGMQKIAPYLDVFVDVATLRSGDRWKERIRSEILRRDVLYLFWSREAAQSPWVEWEWRCAYEARGVDFIDPVPLDPPQQVPPPRELGDELHFNEWVLAYMSAQVSSSRAEGTSGKV